MFRLDVQEDQVERFESLLTQLGQRFRAFVGPTLEAQASIFGLAPQRLTSPRAGQPDLFEQPVPLPDRGEIFTDGRNTLVVTLTQLRQRRSIRTRATQVTDDGQVAAKTFTLQITAIGPSFDSDPLISALALTNEAFAAPAQPFVFRSDQFDELKAEGRGAPAEPSADEIAATEILREKASRVMAIAIKASGGLLVRDVYKQLPHEPREQVDSLVEGLKTAKLVDSEIVVVCSKTQSQVTRAPHRSVIEEIAAKGLKCACGRSLADERTEEALTITDLGRSLLDKARWLTIILIQELGRLGVPRDAMLVEQNVGGDEIDCLANISGELTLFELKDKEFNLGNAYSFGAKIGIIRPAHPVVVTTEHVGNDAKEHFVKARLSTSGRRLITSFDDEDERSDILYVEGVTNLRTRLEELVSRIYMDDAVRAIDGVLPLAALHGRSLLSALGSQAPED